MPTEDDSLQEIERLRRQMKQVRLRNESATVPQLFSLWQETTDLMFRTNLGDGTRVEELAHLQTITFALTAEAHKLNKPRASLQKLQSVLRTQMPREWFQDRATRDAVAAAVHDANVEVQELYFAFMLPKEEESGDAFESLHKLAMDLLEESRAYLQFRLGYGHEWDELRKQIPKHLRATQIEHSQAREALGQSQHELKRATENDLWHGEWGTRFAKARSDDPDSLDAMRATLIAEMRQVVADAEARFVRAEAALRESEGDRLHAERMLAREWREEHLPRLNELIDAFRPEFDRHRHKIGGLVDLAGHELGELAKGASSACQILLTFAERVANSRQQTFQGLEPDQLRALVEREIGFLARSTSPASPDPPPSTIPAGRSNSPPQPAIHDSRVLRTWRAAAKKWRNLLPPIVTARDGTRRIDHAPFEAGPLPPIHYVALELADASDEVAKLARREHVSAATVLRLAAALRDSPGLPTLDQVDLAVEVERVLLVEIALEATHPVHAEEPVPVTPVSEPVPSDGDADERHRASSRVHPAGGNDEQPSTGGLFIRAGARHCELRFHGQRAVVPHSKGMGYIHTLLSHPNEEVHSWTLANGTPPPSSKAEDVIDEETLTAIRKAIQMKQAERAESQDEERRDDLESEIKDMRTHLAGATEQIGSVRRPRRQRNDLEKTREAVGKAIQRALESITKACPELGEHLNTCITNPTGMSPCYGCGDEDRPQWILHENPM